MASGWKSPIYETKVRGKKIIIDVTTSISPGLDPHKTLSEQIATFQEKGVKSVIDFGAGVLRHSIPLLEAGFQVCAVEFEEAFKRDVGAKRLQDVRAEYPNFTRLIWPHEFKKDKRKFDLALLCYVIQTMPIAKERAEVLNLLKGKLKPQGLIFYMSRWGQMNGISKKQSCFDGYYMWPKRAHHSFYREFTTEETHKMFGKIDFKSLRALSERGTEQVYLFERDEKFWA